MMPKMKRKLDKSIINNLVRVAEGLTKPPDEAKSRIVTLCCDEVKFSLFGDMLTERLYKKRYESRKL